MSNVLNIQGSSVKRPTNKSSSSSSPPSSPSKNYSLADTNDTNAKQLDIVASSYTEAMEHIYDSRTLKIAPPVRIPSSCVGNKGAARIALILQQPNTQLQGLALWQNFIGISGSTELSTALQTKTGGRLTHLDLSWNPEIGDEGSEMIAQALTSEHCMLTKLGLAGCNISDIGVTAIANNIKLSFEETETKKSPRVSPRSTGTSLTELSLYANNITSIGAIAIAAALQSEHCLLKRLDLRVNEIQDDGANAILNVLRHAEQSKLQYLDLESNHLSDDTATAICAALRSANCKLTRLHLTNNQITDAGMKKICQGLCSETNSLTYLDLNKNLIGLNGMFELSKALSQDDCRLTHLFVYSNKFNDTKEGEQETAVSMYGGIRSRVPVLLKDLGGVALWKGTTLKKYQELVNKDLLCLIKRSGTKREEEEEEEEARKREKEIAKEKDFPET